MRAAHGLELTEIDVEEHVRKFPIKPLGYRVFVKEFEAMKTTGGLYIPESALRDTKQVNIGYIIALGPDCNPGLEVGQLVYYARYSGAYSNIPIDFDLEEEEYRLMNDEDIFGVYKHVIKVEPQSALP